MSVGGDKSPSFFFVQRKKRIETFSMALTFLSSSKCATEVSSLHHKLMTVMILVQKIWVTERI
jgi:hypothetical protein